MPWIGTNWSYCREAVEVGRDAGVDLRLAEQIAADATEAERNLRCVRCHLPWHESWIDVDGAVYPCHSHGGKALGNVSEGPFRSAWTGEPCRAVRRGDLPACRRCGMNYRRRDPDAAGKRFPIRSQYEQCADQPRNQQSGIRIQL